MPYECFTKCYDATVQSIIDYSAAVWGTKSISSISAVQNRDNDNDNDNDKTFIEHIYTGNVTNENIHKI